MIRFEDLAEKVRTSNPDADIEPDGDPTGGSSLEAIEGRMLVTGGTGFLGGYLLNRLKGERYGLVRGEPGRLPPGVPEA